jgi:hypothetical protein
MLSVFTRIVNNMLVLLRITSPTARLSVSGLLQQPRVPPGMGDASAISADEVFH